MTWIRSGELIFELARSWYAAPYRKKNLVDIVGQLCREDHILGDFVNAAAQHWTLPEGEKEQIEARIRIAQLDYRNYHPEGADPALMWPKDLAADIANFERNKRRAREILAFPENCLRFLANPGLLPDEQAGQIATLMGAADGDEATDLDEEMVRPARVASAAVLLLGAKQWLAANSAVRDRARAIINAAIEETDLDHDRPKLRYSMAPSYLQFAAYLVFHEWHSAPSTSTDHALMQIATSGDERASAVVFNMSYAHRATLGDRWWRLLYLSILWSGLSILKPRSWPEDETRENRWRRWGRWLIARRLSGVRCSVDDINPLDIAKRVEIFEGHQWEAEYRQEGRRFTRDPSRRMSGALGTHFLEIAFAWHVTSSIPLPAASVEREYRRNLLAKFWAHQAWRLTGSDTENTGDYSSMDQFGYNLLEAIAAICLETDVNTAPSLWQPVFDIGPKGHYAIGHFFSCFFSHLSETTDIEAFVAHWRPMIEAVLAAQGWSGGPWYYRQRLERQSLGFGHEDALARPAQSTALVEAVGDLYHSWGAKRLPDDEDNLATFCSFLSTRAGKPLRLVGLMWIADALSHSDARSWHRDRTSAVLVDFLGTILTEDSEAAVAAANTKQALIGLVGLAVSRQLSSALALQDRLTTLL